MKIYIKDNYTSQIEYDVCATFVRESAFLSDAIEHGNIAVVLNSNEQFFIDNPNVLLCLTDVNFMQNFFKLVVAGSHESCGTFSHSYLSDNELDMLAYFSISATNRIYSSFWNEATFQANLIHRMTKNLFIQIIGTNMQTSSETFKGHPFDFHIFTFNGFNNLSESNYTEITNSICDTLKVQLHEYYDKLAKHICDDTQELFLNIDVLKQRIDTIHVVKNNGIYNNSSYFVCFK